MKFKTSSKKFLENLSPILGIVPQRTPYNVLKNHIKISTSEGKIHAVTTDIDIVGKTSFNVDLQKDGETVIPVKKLVDFLKNISDTNLEVQLTDNKMTFKYDKGNFSLPTLSPDEYPEIPVMTSEFEFNISGRLLKKMIDKTAFAINTIGSASVLTQGVLWKVENMKSEMIGASNHRLALFQTEIEKKANFSIVIPQKILTHISNFLTENSVKISVSKDRISYGLNNDEYIFTSRLINYDFPDYSKIVFDESTHKFSVDRKKLIEVVSRVSIFSDTVSYRTKIFFDKKENLEVSASSYENGEAKESINFKRISKSKEEFILPINYHYLIDAVKSIETENVIFLVNEVDRAVEVVPEENIQGEKLIYVLMPLLSKE